VGKVGPLAELYRDARSTEHKTLQEVGNKYLKCMKILNNFICLNYYLSCFKLDSYSI
jgi:hypothetical protein